MMILKVFANVISLFFFQMELTVTNIIYLAIAVLYIIGMYGVFRKCGLKSWHALIPCLREVQLGKAVGMEREGRVAAMLTGIAILMEEVQFLTNGGNTEAQADFLSFIIMFVGLIQLVYMVRMYLALCEVYDRKKFWIVLWATVNAIPAMMWGWMKKYQPLWKAEEMKSDAASFFSGSKACE